MPVEGEDVGEALVDLAQPKARVVGGDTAVSAALVVVVLAYLKRLT